MFDGAAVLDAFAGTGALGLEALSRGAGSATFMETDPAALAALRRNIAACKAEATCRIFSSDAMHPPPGTPCRLVLLDPPYAQDLVPRAMAALGGAGWIAPAALVVAELGVREPLPALGALLAQRAHGAARLAIWRLG